jgi:chromate transporter
LGILFSVGLTVLRTADHHWLAYVVSFLVCGLMLFTRISPLYFMAIAGLLGGFGLIQR